MIYIECYYTIKMSLKSIYHGMEIVKYEWQKMYEFLNFSSI